MDTATTELRAVLAAWPADCQPSAIEPLGAAGGFSGARFWRLDTPRGRLCLRRWPSGHPSPQRLKYIQAVLGHVHRVGFNLVPLPLETVRQVGFVDRAGHLWELTPWLPGSADYRTSPSAARMRAAMTALADFHLAASSFRSTDHSLRQASPGIEERKRRLEVLLDGGFAELVRSVDLSPRQAPLSVGRDETASGPAELHRRALAICQHFPVRAAGILDQLSQATKLYVPLQPCIRDIWHDHVLFEGDRVSGIVDFGGLRPENVSADVARLLGSLAADDHVSRTSGLAAYEAIRPLAADERALLAAFDRSGVLLSGLNWLTWLYLERRTFDDSTRVLARLDEIIARLEHSGGA